MGKLVRGAALAGVVGLVVTGAVLAPGGASGLTEAARLVAAAHPAGLPTTLAADPRVAFSRGADAVAEVGLDFPVEYEEPQDSGDDGGGWFVSDVEVGDPQVTTSGRAHEGETSTAQPPPGVEDAYAVVTTDPGSGDVDVEVRRLLPAQTSGGKPTWESVRVTCDDAQETHPVLSPDLSLVAYATDASGDWEVVVATTGEECAGDDAVSPAPGRGSDELWPAWGRDGEILFFSSTRDDPLGDLYAVPIGSSGGSGSASAVAADAVVTAGTVGRLTDDPGADTMPTVVDLQYGEMLVLFTTTRFRAEGSVATMPLEYWWWPVDDPSESPSVSDPFCDEEPTPEGGCPELVAGVPAVGSEPSARLVELDDEGAGVLLAWTVPDDEGEPSVWVAYLDGTFSPVVHEAWPVAAAAPASHADWVDVTSIEWEGSDDGPDAASARLRFTQRTGGRVVADARAATGTGMRVVSPTGEDRLDDAQPAYAPDGTRLALATRPPVEFPQDPDAELGDLLVGDPGTRVYESLDPAEPYGAANPDWSPDGSHVAYSSVDGSEESPGVGWIDVGSGRQDWVVDDGASSWSALHPSWSPDGEWVLAEAGQPQEGGSSSALVVLRVATREWVPLTLDVVADCPRYSTDDRCPVRSATLHGREPAWSPDGTRIAVSNLRVEGEPAVAPGGISVLDVEPADLTNATSADDVPVVTGVRALTGMDADARVRTTQPDVVPTPGPSEEPEPLPVPPVVPTPSRGEVAVSGDPAWTGDGRRVVFSGQAAGRPDDRDLYSVVAADGTGLRTVVDSPAVLTDPDVQPVGDVAVRVAADPGRLAPGTGSDVTVTVTNPGRAPATPTVVVGLPAGLRAGDLPTGCEAAPGAAAGTTLVTCRPGRTLAPGGRLVVVLPVVATAAGAHAVTAVVVNPGAEADVADNAATTTLTVVAPDEDGTAARLAVSVELSEPRAWVGGPDVLVTVTVRNTGDATASDLVLTAAPPPGAEPAAPVDDDAVDDHAATDDCLGAWGTCPVTDLLPGGEVEVVAALAPAGPAGTGTVTVGATARSGGAETTADDSADLEVLQPWVRLLPEVLRPGKVVLAYGEDFPPDADVHLTWSAGITTAPGPYRTNADGRLSVPVVVVSNDLRGERWLRVTSGAPTDLAPLLDAGFPREVEPPETPDDAPVAPPCPDVPAPGALWCELDVPLLVVTPNLGAPDFLERG
ncbi:hypothetical protein [Cellulosimicrobium marinum]|uniref:hypothetical protein n=1 Tax=Cellulosimicrobium marinum TaxID=1638992 RepID=UPI001E5AE39B|nr:hypothetical protein [Cellulosimicrobium marinum]MCB7135685.1 hypothetical protein [Cellulosimicrobium marinum]